MINLDGTANCDRCGTPLAGYGVLYGLICTDLNPAGDIDQLIYCYVGGCRDVVLNMMINYVITLSEPACNTCQVPCDPRSTDTAMLAADLNPDGTSRQLTFCYVNGHREQIRTQGHL